MTEFINWHHRARCAIEGEDPELFFPVSQTTRSGKLQVEEAKLICGRCEATAECLHEALNLAAEGIWGNTTDREREAINRRRKKHLAKEALAKQIT